MALHLETGMEGQPSILPAPQLGGGGAAPQHDGATRGAAAAQHEQRGLLYHCGGLQVGFREGGGVNVGVWDAAAANVCLGEGGKCRWVLRLTGSLGLSC